jgi:Bacterial regulatory proteins, gntR family
MDPPNLDDYRLRNGDTERLLAAKAKTKRPSLPQHKRGEWFLCGPIPGAWLAVAARLPGRALHVALAIWHEVKIGKSGKARLTHSALARFGVSPHVAHRALPKLEAAGLVTVERRNGCAPRVIICTTDLTTRSDNGIIVP